MPPGTFYVGRPSIYGNPFPVYNDDPALSVRMFREWWEGRGDPKSRFFGMFPERMDRLIKAIFEPPYPVRGKDVCCWCRVDRPCHGDVVLELLELANA